MWATADESRDDVIGLWHRAWAHADAAIDTLAIDAPGSVRWWGHTPVTLHHILVHMLAEVNRHAGHADIVRELVDGQVGWRRPGDNVVDRDEATRTPSACSAVGTSGNLGQFPSSPDGKCPRSALPGPCQPSMRPVAGSTMARKSRMFSLCSSSDRSRVGLIPNP
ncbi:DUF664 domain-containing protein [Micromonospora profundi]|uniref:mycothiol transferase n=1 Tax=Micromonospora profundi TaxID=1420889 RepID=UPI003656D05F